MNTFYLLEAEEDEAHGLLAKELCALDGSADGLLLVAPSERAAAKMRVFNRDGSEASMCGNGLRCVARYVCERDGVEEAVIETMKADLQVRKEPVLLDGIAMYGVEISPVSFRLEDLPMNYENQSEWVLKPLPFLSEDIPFTAVAVPNPHLIGIVPASYQKDSSHQKQWAELFNGTNEYFSDGVNVSYVSKAEQGIFVRTFERGVGFTNACGTAMTASALVSCLAEIVPYGEVEVYNPGGMVKCSVNKQGDTFQLRLTGNATYLSSHRFVWQQEPGTGEFTESRDLGEQAQYEGFIEQISDVIHQFA